MSPLVGVIMGSDSDWPVMSAAASALDEFEVAYEAHVVSAHRTPDEMVSYARDAAGRGLRVIIAGAGGAAHLPGMVASMTPLPVIGVPVPLAHLDGLDSLLSIVQMPAGVPVATVSVGGARNAGLLAVRILAVSDASLRDRMTEFQGSLRQLALDKDQSLQQRLDPLMTGLTVDTGPPIPPDRGFRGVGVGPGPLSGSVVDGHACFAIGARAVVLPHGYGAVQDDDGTLILLDADGHEVARTGDTVVSGTSYRDAPLTETPHSPCFASGQEVWLLEGAVRRWQRR